METFTFLMTSSFYPPYHIGGACVHVKYLSQELAKRGNEVHVMHSVDAYRLKRGGKIPTDPEAYNDGVHVHSIDSPIKTLDPLMVYTFGRSFQVQKRFSELVKEIHPNIVHHHNISLLGYNILEKRDNYLSLYTAHDYWLICPTSNLLKKEKTCFDKGCFSCALRSKRPPQLWRSFTSLKTAIENIDLMIVPSDYVRRRLTQEIDVNTITLPNFVPLPPENISPIGYSNYFLFVGRLEKDKGIINLLNLFEDLKNCLNSKLIIVGKGSLENYVQDFVAKHSLQDYVLFLGSVDNKKLYSLYANALAVIIPSIWPENAPLVALEAISVGTPVIASNMGGLPEIVGKIDKRLIFNDFKELGEILQNFSKKRYPSSKIKEIFNQNFGPKKYVDNYLAILGNLQSRMNNL